jgi:hypothetical protein
MSPKTHATIGDLYKVEGKAELVHGEIVEMPPTGDDPGFASLRVAARLLSYTEQTGRGRAYGDGVGFHVNLPHRSRSARMLPTTLAPAWGCGLLKAHQSLRSRYVAKTTMGQRQSRPNAPNAPITSPVVPSSSGILICSVKMW